METRIQLDKGAVSLAAALELAGVVSSPREAEHLIREGQVELNGHVETDSAVQVLPGATLVVGVDPPVQIVVEGELIADFRLLHEASKRVHGYLVYTWFEKYLTLIVANLRRLLSDGHALGVDARPSEETNYRVPFDCRALDLGALLDFLGIYFYIFSCHKKTNSNLMGGSDRKRVLYLRGYDLEGAVGGEGGVAVGISTMHTTAFNYTLIDLLADTCDVYKALSPRDLYWESNTAQKYFYGDLDGLIQFAGSGFRSFYVNTHHWQEDVEWFMDRSDYFIVYLSSMTPSVLWEIETLRDNGRAGDTTIVFDEHAIENKDRQVDTSDFAKRDLGHHVRWGKAKTPPPDISPGALRARLEQDFLVLGPEEFKERSAEQTQRIAAASAPISDSERNQPLAFRFYPALKPKELQQIRDADSDVEQDIRERLESRTIENLPWFLNQVQLKIYTSEILGNHAETGWALAVYAGILKEVHEHWGQDDTPVENDEATATLLSEHFELAEYYAPRLMAYGREDQFGNYSEQALRRYDQAFGAASESTAAFLAEFQRRNR